jgi:hypothetical protein
MDEKGYTITPLAFLLLIPVIIFAVAFGDIVNEINQFSTVTIGSDVTGGTVSSIISAIKDGAGDSGRYASYNASRKVIDDQRFISDSKAYTRQVVTHQLNVHVIDTCSKLSRETGRQIYINNVLIPTNLTNTTFNDTFSQDDITVTQVDPYGNGDPFGFYVVVKAGVPIKVVQKDQVYEGTLPEIRGYAPLEGIEDPYIWMKSSFRNRDIIYSYPHYEKNYLGKVDYHFNDTVSGAQIQYLWDCLNGTNNTQNQSLLPQYFPDPSGLNFFERLQGGQISGENNATRISTFIIGNPLSDVYKTQKISALDHEYFAGVTGSGITINGAIPFNDPAGQPFYLSQTYKNYFPLASNYNI